MRSRSISTIPIRHKLVATTLAPIVRANPSMPPFVRIRLAPCCCTTQCQHVADVSLETLGLTPAPFP
ncbi:MAG: hypothetical protein OXF06_03875, partial [Bacteroidetes bacterium]|nr:hypothetical protein [Bacteroidota bacterium]